MSTAVRNRRIDRVKPRFNAGLPEDPEALQKYVEELEAAIAIGRSIASLPDQPGWKALETSLYDELDVMDQRLDEFEGKTDREITILLANRLRVRKVVAKVAGAAENVVTWEGALATARLKLKELMNERATA